MNNSEVKSSLNEFGELLHPDIHDAELLMIKNHDNELIITFELCSKDVIQASFKGVSEFICNAFGRQNIVLDMTIDTRRLVSVNHLEKVYSRPLVVSEKHDTLIRLLQKKIQQGECCWVEINPSCGCEVYILCRSVEFRSVAK